VPLKDSGTANQAQLYTVVDDHDDDDGIGFLGTQNLQCGRVAHSCMKQIGPWTT